MYINFNEIQWINYNRTDFFPLVIQIFAFPFAFIFFTAFSLIISFQTIASKYTCNLIKNYLGNLEKILLDNNEEKVIYKICDKQNELELWSYNLNKLTSVCNGLL